MESERPDLDKLEELAKAVLDISCDDTKSSSRTCERGTRACYIIHSVKVDPFVVLQWIAYTRELEKTVEFYADPRWHEHGLVARAALKVKP